MASSPKDPKQQKTKPIRRNDVIHCENCGEDYSVTYKRCPFCDERPAKNGRPRTAGGRRVAGGGRSGRPANPLQVAALVGSLVLIIVAMYIVFTSLAPLFSKGACYKPFYLVSCCLSCPVNKSFHQFISAGIYPISLNPNSLTVLKNCVVEENLKDAKAYDSFQFVRQGFFCVDAKDSTADHLVFNRIVSLKSSFKLPNA